MVFWNFNALISANIGRVRPVETELGFLINRTFSLECPFGDYLLRGRGANIEITFHLVRNPEIKIGEARYANRCGFVLTIGGTLRKSILSDAAEIVDEIQYFFEVVCSTIFLYQVRSGYFRAGC
jgi:hypothetical protein